MHPTPHTPPTSTWTDPRLTLILAVAALLGWAHEWARTPPVTSVRLPEAPPALPLVDRGPPRDSMPVLVRTWALPAGELAPAGSPSWYPSDPRVPLHVLDPVEGTLSPEGMPLPLPPDLSPETSLYLSVDLRAGDPGSLRVRTSAGQELSMGRTLSPRVGVVTWTQAQRQELGDPASLHAIGPGAGAVRLRGLHLLREEAPDHDGKPITHLQVLITWVETLLASEPSQGTQEARALARLLSVLRARLLLQEEPGYTEQQFRLIDMGMCLRALRRRTEARDLSFLGPDAWVLPMSVRPLVNHGASADLRRAAEITLFHPRGPMPPRLDALYAHELVPSEDPEAWLATELGLLERLGPGLAKKIDVRGRVLALGAQLAARPPEDAQRQRFQALIRRGTGAR